MEKGAKIGQVNDSGVSKTEKNSYQANPNLQPKFKENDIKIVVKEIPFPGTPNKYLRFTNNLTIAAFQSPTSFAIVKSRTVLIIVQNSTEVYSDELTRASGLFLDIIYIDHLNCYLLIYKDKIFRKDIDGTPPYLFMDLDCQFGDASCCKYSKFNQKLIVVKDFENVLIIDLNKRRAEIEIRPSDPMKICRLVLLGRAENKIVFITLLGKICVYTINYDLKKICGKQSHQVQLIDERMEFCLSLAVCEKKSYILADFFSRTAIKSSRMILFKQEDYSLTQLAVLDELQMTQDAEIHIIFECWGVVGKHVLWVGLSKGEGFAFCMSLTLSLKS